MKFIYYLEIPNFKTIFIHQSAILPEFLQFARKKHHKYYNQYSKNLKGYEYKKLIEKSKNSTNLDEELYKEIKEKLLIKIEEYSKNMLFEECIKIQEKLKVLFINLNNLCLNNCFF